MLTGFPVHSLLFLDPVHLISFCFQVQYQYIIQNKNKTSKSYLSLLRIMMQKVALCLHCKVVWGCTTVMIPFFSGQLVLSSLPIYHQCAAHVHPHFHFLENFAFSAFFLVKTSALKMQIPKLLFPRLPFFKKICSLNPTFGRPHLKQKLSALLQ